MIVPAAEPLRGPVVLHSGDVLRDQSVASVAGPCVVVADGAVGVRIERAQIGPCGTGVDGIGVDVRPGARRVTVIGSSIHDISSGFYARHALNPVVFSGNRVWNVRGPLPRGQMLQLDGVHGPGRTRITGNVSDRASATITTHYEDHISMYRSSGTRAAPIEIACNEIRGGDSDTGSAIMLGDHGGGWFDVHHNTVVESAGAGIGIAGAHDVRVRKNVVFNAGATAESKTDTVVSVFRYAGNTPTGIELSGNHGIARNWLHGGIGQLGPGLWSDGRARQLRQRGNRWRDHGLTGAIWGAPLPGCGALPPIAG